ncbi:MAG: 5'-nucleotidase C-terminal domain-containing protein [Armatimonadetes bacterium]|nr:5'-nucleotidase C-terminal domain-containing protein [Armatimonadota bacterium]
MQMRIAGCAWMLVLAVALGAQTVMDAASGPHAGAQAAADHLRAAASADLAFLPAGLLVKEPSGSDLASLLRYPTDELVVLKVSGAEILAALERSVANYPESNSAFLQLSGVTVTISRSAAAGSRILQVRVGETDLEAGREYEVAMPAPLAGGALGYFKIWNRPTTVRALGLSLQKVLKGKTGGVSTPRYIVRP